MPDTIFTPTITDDIVKLHEDYFVPAIYAQWAYHLTELSRIELGQSLLDVACLTGTLARSAKLETGFKGRVVGLDKDEQMLAKAKQLSPGIEWQAGSAGRLPFKDNQFDRVTCLFALTLVRNKVAVLKEMLRVCKPGGLVGVAVMEPLHNFEAYRRLVEMVRQFAGAAAADNVSKPFSLGAAGKMDSILLSAGANEFECHQRPGIAIFPSINSFVEAHLRAAGGYYNVRKDDFQALRKVAHQELSPYLIEGGKIAAALDAEIFLIRAE